MFAEITVKKCVKDRTVRYYPIQHRKLNLCNIARPSEQQLSSCS